MCPTSGQNSVSIFGTITSKRSYLQGLKACLGLEVVTVFEHCQSEARWKELLDFCRALRHRSGKSPPHWRDRDCYFACKPQTISRLLQPRSFITLASEDFTSASCLAGSLWQAAFKVQQRSGEVLAEIEVIENLQLLDTFCNIANTKAQP